MDLCTTATAATTYYNCVITQQPQEADMEYYAPKITWEEKQKKHLTDRLYSIKSHHRNQLLKDFGFLEDEPETIKEAKKRFAAGDYTLEYNFRGKDDDDDDFQGMFIRWTKKEKDSKGFKAAEELLNKTYEQTKDEIIVKDNEAGLEALRGFEQKTFH